MEKTHAPAGSIFLAFLHTATPVAGLAGAVGSIGLLFHASRSRPPLLMVLFVVWVLSPFVAIVFTRVGSRRWPLRRNNGSLLWQPLTGRARITGMRFDYAPCRARGVETLESRRRLLEKQADPTQDFSTASDSCRIGSNSEILLD